MTANRYRAFVNWTRTMVFPHGSEIAEHDYHHVFLRCKEDLSELLGPRLSDSKILVLGCGYNYPDVVLWSSVARMVVGVDVIHVFWRNGNAALHYDRQKTCRTSIAGLARELTQRRIYRQYYDRLQALTGMSLEERFQDLVSYDGLGLPFADGVFDVVISNAVLEHVANPMRLMEEILRVTKPSGINYHLWHNYCSLNGAHIMDNMAEAHPWGHLLGDPEVESWIQFTKTALNRVRPEEMIQLLSKFFRPIRIYGIDRKHAKKDIDADFEYEGEELLTPQLEKKLSQYTRESLLTRSYLFIGEK